MRRSSSAGAKTKMKISRRGRGNQKLPRGTTSVPALIFSSAVLHLFRDASRDIGFRRGIPDERNDAAREAVPQGLAVELPVLHAPRGLDEGARHVDDGRGEDGRGQRVLVLVRAEGADLPVFGALEDAERRRVGILEEEITALVRERERRRFRARHVLERAREDAPRGSARMPRDEARLVREERGFDRGQLDAAHHTGLARLRHAARDEAAQIGRLLELENDGREVRGRLRARGRDEDRPGILLRDALGGVLELESVAEHEVRAFRRVGPELLLEFRRRLHLDVRDGRAQLLLDGLEAFVRSRVPAGVRDRAGRQQRHAEARRLRERLGFAAGDESEGEGRGSGGCHEPGGEGQRARLHPRIMPPRPIIAA